MIDLPDHIFRGYDIRGIAGTDLTEHNVPIIARTYATWLIKRNIFDCVLGYDCRLSSKEYYSLTLAELIKAGITVYDIGLTTTPMSYFAQYVFRTRGLIMITASHNPKEFNGFKLGKGFSESMGGDDIQEFKDMCHADEDMQLQTPGKHIPYDIFPEYLEDLMRHIPPSEVDPMKIVVDSSAGTTGPFNPEILRAYGCDVVEKNTTPDGNFPVGTPDPTETEIGERISKAVIEENVHLGFSYDGDGDRMGVVDEEGKLVGEDTLCALFAQDILRVLPGAKIVFNDMCSKQLSDVIKSDGGKPVMWLTGSAYIKDKIRETGAPFGGELSGHFYFNDNFYGHDDAAYATLRLLQFLHRNKTTLSLAVSKLPQYISSPEITVRCPDDVKLKVVSDEIAPHLKTLYPEASIHEMDGIRLDTHDEMVVIRASQNGPYIAIKFEAREKYTFDQLRDRIRTILHDVPSLDFSTGVNIELLA